MCEHMEGGLQVYRNPRCLAKEEEEALSHHTHTFWHEYLFSVLEVLQPVWEQMLHHMTAVTNGKPPDAEPQVDDIQQFTIHSWAECFFIQGFWGMRANNK